MTKLLIGSVCNEVESQTSTICVPRSRSISHGSRCSVNELEDTVGRPIPSYPPPTVFPRVLEKAQRDQCELILIHPPGNLVPTTLRDVGTISTPDSQHSSVTIPASRSDPSQSLQDGSLEAFQSTLPPVSVVSTPQQESTLAIYESKWRIFTAWSNIHDINPLSASESVVSGFLHTETLAISTTAGYQMAIKTTFSNC